MTLAVRKDLTIKPRLLLLTNEVSPGSASGQKNGYELLVETGEIQSFLSVSLKEGFDNTPAFERVLSALYNFDYDVVVVWSPNTFPSTQSDFSQILSAIGGRPILYWEGDPWGDIGQKKAFTIQMSWWMSHSEIVFSTAGEPHISVFKKIGANKIFFIPNTYCHFKFLEEEKTAPPKLNSSDKIDFLVIASNTAKIPGFSGLPGSFKRWELVTRLKFKTQYNFHLYGNNWPKGWSKGYLPYNQQAKTIRNSRVSLNWDNFHYYDDYSSDRLPIAMIAGRPHITTKHNGMTWAPSKSFGLFQECSPKDVVNRAEELIDLGADTLWQLGLESHKWAKHRMSHREAARYIMSVFYDHIASPPADPWSNLPGPW